MDMYLDIDMGIPTDEGSIISLMKMKGVMGMGIRLEYRNSRLDYQATLEITRLLPSTRPRTPTRVWFTVTWICLVGVIRVFPLLPPLTFLLGRPRILVDEAEAPRARTKPSTLMCPVRILAMRRPTGISMLIRRSMRLERLS